MVIADTSIWIDHFKKTEKRLVELLSENRILIHQFIIGELACGNLKNRNEIISLLDALPQAIVAIYHEVLKLVDDHKLYGTGIGWIDAHLIASAKLSKARIWTKDKNLSKIADLLDIACLDI